MFLTLQNVGTGKLGQVQQRQRPEVTERASRIEKRPKQDRTALEQVCRGHGEPMELRQQRLYRPHQGVHGRQAQTPDSFVSGIHPGGSRRIPSRPQAEKYIYLVLNKLTCIISN